MWFFEPDITKHCYLMLFAQLSFISCIFSYPPAISTWKHCKILCLSTSPLKNLAQTASSSQLQKQTMRTNVFFPFPARYCTRQNEFDTRDTPMYNCFRSTQTLQPLTVVTGFRNVCFVGKPAVLPKTLMKQDAQSHRLLQMELCTQQIHTTQHQSIIYHTLDVTSSL